MDAEHSETMPNDLTPEAEFLAGLLGALDFNTVGDENVDYKQLYYYLFNGITDILNGANTYLTTTRGLMDLQRCAEELFCRLSESVAAGGDDV